MIIKNIYEMKNATVGQVMGLIDEFEAEQKPGENDAIDRLAETLELDFAINMNEENCMFASWKEAPNNIRITKGFRSLFLDVTQTLWAAYLSLGLIIGSTEWFGDGSGRTGYLQEFVRFGRKYWVICEEDGIVFLLPEEY